MNGSTGGVMDIIVGNKHNDQLQNLDEAVFA